MERGDVERQCLDGSRWRRSPKSGIGRGTPATSCAGRPRSWLSGRPTVGTVKVSTSGRFDGPRWERLRDVVLPQIALAIASAAGRTS